MSASTAIPRIDVDTASRAKLISHIDTIEAALAAAYPRDGEVARYQYAFGLTFVEALIVAALAKRGRATREHLRNTSRRRGDEDNMRGIDVLMVRIRRKLKPFDIEIRAEWGAGYHIAPENLHRLRSLLSERAA